MQYLLRFLWKVLRFPVGLLVREGKGRKTIGITIETMVLNML